MGAWRSLGARLNGIQKVRGSIPLVSTKVIAGRTPDGEIYLFMYGFVLAVKIASRS